jgi:hypothetical protein
VTEVQVHGGAIAALSDPLNRLINGPMAEGTTHRVHFPQLGMDDFERLCEFAYSGDYTAPAPTIFSAKSPELDDSGQELPEAVYKSLHNPALDADGECHPQDRTIKNLFLKWCTPQDRENSVPFKDLDLPRNLKWEDDFGPVLLGHARLYAFAHIYMIPKLQNTALRKLHCTLTGFSIYKSSYASIVELARFAYADGVLPNRQKLPQWARPQIDPLRSLVVDYVALLRMFFAGEQVHRELMEEGGEYPADLLQAMANFDDVSNLL